MGDGEFREKILQEFNLYLKYLQSTSVIKNVIPSGRYGWDLIFNIIWNKYNFINVHFTDVCLDVGWDSIGFARDVKEEYLRRERYGLCSYRVFNL